MSFVPKIRSPSPKAPQPLLGLFLLGVSFISNKAYNVACWLVKTQSSMQC